MEAALVAVRFVQFAAAMVLFGSAAFALAFAQQFPAGTAVRREFDRALRRGLVTAAIAALVSAALWLDLEGAIMGNGWDRAVDPHTISLVLFETVFGRAWCCHLVLGVLLLGILLSSERAAATFPVAVLAAAFVASLAWAGHAVMHPGGGHLVVQAIHLLAGGLWLGSLPALLYLLARAQRDRTPDWQGAVRRMLPLYSQAAYFAVGVVLLTGIVNSVFLVGSIDNLVATAFGRVLLVKVTLVLIMLGVAATNRWVLWPKINAERRAGEGGGAMAALHRSVAVELAVGGFVLLAVSLLGILPAGMAAMPGH